MSFTQKRKAEGIVLFYQIVWSFAKKVVNFVIYSIFIYMIMNKLLLVCHGNTAVSQELAILMGQNGANYGIEGSRRIEEIIENSKKQ